MHTTREQWLHAAADFLLDNVLLPEIAAIGETCTRPPIRISVGWAKGRRSAKAVGQCYPREMSADGVNEIFISPSVDTAADVAIILLHELIHALDDCEHGHKGRFARIAHAVGFTSPLTEHIMTEDLTALGALVADEIGPLPHKHLAPPDDGTTKSGNRQKKLHCIECGLIMRASATAIAALPCPALCPCCERRGLVPA